MSSSNSATSQLVRSRLWKSLLGVHPRTTIANTALEPIGVHMQEVPVTPHNVQSPLRYTAAGQRADLRTSGAKLKPGGEILRSVTREKHPSTGPLLGRRMTTLILSSTAAGGFAAAPLGAHRVDWGVAN